MSRTLARQQTPEQQELTRRRLVLSALRAVLLDREKALAALRAQLHSFEGRYVRQVGVLYKQLDEWEQKIAELNSPLLIPEGAAAPEETDEAFTEYTDEPDQPELILDLKLLFRELAKRIHPDFASNPTDAQLRTLLMAQANDAFRRKDAGMLQRMLHGQDPTAEPEDTAAELARVLEQIVEVERSTAQLEAETAALARSEMARLQERTLAAAEKGRDLLAEMAARVKGNIGMAMRRYELDLVRKQRNEPVFDPAPLLSAEAPVSRG